MNHKPRYLLTTQKKKTVTSTVFLPICMIVSLNFVTSISAHEVEPTLSSEIAESNSHDDHAPTIEEEAQILYRAEQERIGENPNYSNLGSTRQFAKIRNNAANNVGQWSNLESWPVVPVFVSLLNDGRVLAFDSVGDRPTESYQTHNFTRATIWDPTTNQFSDARVDTGYNLFCSGFASLPDGRLFVAGGNANSRLSGLRQTHLFSPLNNSWERELDMQSPRWYPAVTPLSNGEMLITGGGPSISEVRETDGQLRKLTGAAQSYWANRDYPWLQTAPDGRVAFFGPNKQLGYITTTGNGSWQSMGNREQVRRDYGSYAMYNIGKVLIAGGGMQNSGHDQRSSLIINLNNNSVSPTGAMSYRRRQHNLTILADGSVLATGGFSSNQGLVDLNNSVFAAELWNPGTGKWTTLSSEARARHYHSTALLLPDGRVLSAGGGICGTCQSVGYLQKNGQIFSPPYLFNSDGSGELAARPIIENIPSEVGYSQSFILETPQADQIIKAGLVRTGSVTHSQNMEQRYIPLSFSVQNGTLDITSPNNSNIAPPGHYMLFIVNDPGVPSVARIVRIDPNVSAPPPPVSAPICSTGVDPQTIRQGEGTALWWWSDTVTSANINNGIGSVTIPSNFKWLYPAETTTFKMTAKGANGASTTCETTVVVEGQPIGNPPACEMGADPQIINAGEGSALWWWSQNVASASINNDIGSAAVPSDFTWFYPTQTKTYRMSAVGSNGDAVSCETTITVQ